MRLAELADERHPPRVELDAVPFFPQRDYQCGPAALATVLASAGRPAEPDALVDEVYVPERRGSFQPELVAAMRSRGLLPYRLAPALSDAVAQLAAGRPVLVMQNLGFAIRPVWHFAVVVGYDAPANSVLLRSGTTERRVMRARRFDRTWARAERWAVVALEPGELPAAPDLDRYLTGAAGLEAVGQLGPARAAYLRARDEWPQSAWPWLGLANLSHAGGDLAGARDAYREALERDRDNVAALHNLAETLVSLGCAAEARAEIERALELARGTRLEEPVAATAAKLTSAPAISAAVAADCAAPVRR